LLELVTAVTVVVVIVKLNLTISDVLRMTQNNNLRDCGELSLCSINMGDAQAN